MATLAFLATKWGFSKWSSICVTWSKNVGNFMRKRLFFGFWDKILIFTRFSGNFCKIGKMSARKSLQKYFFFCGHFSKSRNLHLVTLPMSKQTWKFKTKIRKNYFLASFWLFASFLTNSWTKSDYKLLTKWLTNLRNNQNTFF